MKTAACLLACVSALAQGLAQAPMPIGVLRGDLVSVQAGQLEIRSPENALLSCLFDTKTYFEREHQSIPVLALAAGDPVEVVADRDANGCYARTVHVVAIHTAAAARPKFHSPTSPTETLAPRGDFMFGGIVVRNSASRLTIRTRAGDVYVLLRPDTRLIVDGLRITLDSIVINSHVFIRAGRNAEGDLEAYQIFRGEITQ
jgi:Domain of unknown function (DUF5666)